jgi:allantoate deiminase
MAVVEAQLTRPQGGQAVYERCRALALVSEEPGRLTRPFASPAMGRANALVGGWMAEAGLDVSTDAAGNLVGHWPGTDPAAGTLLLGSHLDTVRDAGAFDGPLGVLVAVEAVARLQAAGTRLPFAVDVLGFSDEEGLRFGTAYLGSRAVAGALGPDLLALRDEDGVTVAGALRAFGCDPGLLPRASRRGERLLGYLEVHMEQGPVLEDGGRPVGVVSAISGATRLAASFRGVAGHAGTVPMAARRDALCAAAEWVLAVEGYARSVDGLLATVGQLAARPGAPNVIPGTVEATLDVRHADDAVRERAVGVLSASAAELGAARGVDVGLQTRLVTPSVPVDPALTGLLERAIAGRGLEPVSLPSGAGHDAVMLSRLTGVAMLFVRCAGGLSHHPDESVSADDIAVAVDVVCDVLGAMAGAG